jgi:hypothetical protein
VRAVRDAVLAFCSLSSIHLFQICQPLKYAVTGAFNACGRGWTAEAFKAPGWPLTRSLCDIQTKITMEIAF